MTAERAVMLRKKVIYYGEFGYLNCSCVRKKYLSFLTSSRDKFTLLLLGVSIQFSTKLGKKVFHKKNCCDLNLGKSLRIFTFFLFSDSEVYLLDGFYFILIHFEWRDTENQQ